MAEGVIKSGTWISVVILVALSCSTTTRVRPPPERKPTSVRRSMFIDFTEAQADLRQEVHVYRFHRSTSRPPSGGPCL